MLEIESIVPVPTASNKPHVANLSRLVGMPSDYGKSGWWFGSGDPEFWKFADKLVVPGGKALDLGMGYGRTAFPFALRGMEVIGYDCNPDAVNIVQDLVAAYPFIPLEARQEDLLTADFGESQYDLVTLGQTFIHFSSREDAYHVLDKAMDALKHGGHLWIRAAGKMDSGYEQLNAEAKYQPTETQKLNDHVFFSYCGCAGEYKQEHKLYFNQLELLQYFSERGARIVHSQTLPEQGQMNFMYGEDWLVGDYIVQGGAITIIAQKR